MVIYVNRSCSRSVKSIIGGFSGVIKCTKERLTNTVVILKAWSSIKGPKVVRNASRDSCSWLSKSKSIISPFIDLLRGSFSLSSSS
jgi:hypothetical protein